jgi:type IV pilus assembly protein PilA
MRNKKGFTLIEVLLVIVIIAILAGIVIIAINPGRQIAQANNAQRSSDVKALLDAVHQYSIEQRGVLPAVITAAALPVADGVANADLCSLLVPTYLSAMPVDPTVADAHYTDCTDYDTGYAVLATGTNVTVSAPGAELEETIAVTL